MSETRLVLKDRYEVERELGRGGMSIVYLAKDRALLSRQVVIKVLLEGMSSDPWIRQKFKQEMEALTRIDHPGVVGVLDTGETPEGKQFLVMKYIEGVTLRSAIDANPGGMPLVRAAGIIRQVGQALSAAHEKGVWHRDVKPDNIMLQSQCDGDERVILIDFGIAGIKNSVFSGERTKIAGSLAYMAPEQSAGNPSAFGDTYSLGAVAYEMLTGKLPFLSASARWLPGNAGLPTQPRSLRPEIPEAAERAILRAMSVQPEARHARIRDCSEELYHALTPGSGGGTRKSRADGSREMAHVLFMDLVNYSLMPMDKQKECRDQLTEIVRGAPRFCTAEAEDNVITLSTGDGMALAFFGDPVAAAQCALEIAAALTSRPYMKLRMGIHTGPVYFLRDVNENADVAGGGINMAQRVMDCGDPGHILVSEAAADVLAQESEWAPCLTSLGEQSVKHGVKVHLYNLTKGDLGNPARPGKLPPLHGGTGAKIALAAAVAALLIAVAAAWWLLRPKDVLQLGYSITVQKYRDGKAYGNPFKLAKEVVFESNYRIAVEVSSPQPGYLYILNEGPDKTGKRIFNLLVPQPGGSALYQPPATMRIPPTTDGFQFDEATGSETLYLIWAKQPVSEMEWVKTVPNVQHHSVVIEDADRMKRISDFLESHIQQKVEIRKDEKARQTNLRGTDQVLVHSIPLEHQ